MEPLLFEPYLRPQIWGGRRLGELLGKTLPPEGKYGESWEISSHPHHVSRVAEGPVQGTSLLELCAHHSRDIFGNKPPGDLSFPLLIKFLDCHDLLSIQVHPSDEAAARLGKTDRGKTEAWMVLEAKRGSRIFAGLLPGITRAKLERHLEKGSVDQCLQAFRPRKGDCLFLPAGTVHAVGGGVVLAEVQQNSDATFRLFDWNRLGDDGQPRPLHLRESLETIDWEMGPVYPVAGTPLPGLPGNARGERLVSCPYFILERITLSGPMKICPLAEMSIWMLLEGSAILSNAGQNYRRLFRRGETVLLPASAAELSWEPAAPDSPPTLAAIRVP